MSDHPLHVVIFSSGEHKIKVNTIANYLEQKGCKCTKWMDMFTRIDQTHKFALLPSLLKKIPTYDFAVIIAGADDTIKKSRNGDEMLHKGMRDNVIFEIGLCIMALGQNKVIVLAHDDVYLFDDLIGVNGIHEEGNLTADCLGVRCFTYCEQSFSNLLPLITSYLFEQRSHFTPIIIGAASSTAIGYYSMFIERFCTLSRQNKEIREKHIELNILIPYSIDDNIGNKIVCYYSANGYMQYKLNDGLRNLTYWAKAEGDTIVVVDIPTSIGTSYNTAVNILALDANDIELSSDKERFLNKESTLFLQTLTKLIDSSNQDIAIRCRQINI